MSPNASGGCVAQRESTPFTREGSQVQSLSRPPFKAGFAGFKCRAVARQREGGLPGFLFAPHSLREAPRPLQGRLYWSAPHWCENIRQQKGATMLETLF